MVLLSFGWMNFVVAHGNAWEYDLTRLSSHFVIMSLRHGRPPLRRVIASRHCVTSRYVRSLCVVGRIEVFGSFCVGISSFRCVCTGKHVDSCMMHSTRKSFYGLLSIGWMFFVAGDLSGLSSHYAFMSSRHGRALLRHVAV